MKVYVSIQVAQDSVDTLGIGEHVEIAGRHAEVARGKGGAKVFTFNRSHQVDTSRPNDGRMYIKRSDVSTQYQ